jgi:endoglucanase
MLRAARFGRWGLPPDWVAIPQAGDALQPAPGWPRRFSYDAVRVPLYMAWSGLHAEPGVVGPARLWTEAAHRDMPAWVDLISGATSSYPAPSGMVAIARLAIASISGNAAKLPMPSVSQATEYSSAALTLLARLAWRDAGLPA